MVSGRCICDVEDAVLQLGMTYSVLNELCADGPNCSPYPPLFSFSGCQHYDEYFHSPDYRSHLAQQLFDSVKESIEDDPFSRCSPSSHSTSERMLLCDSVFAHDGCTLVALY